ncbi:calcium-binding protein [Microcoleus sp. N3A4]|uniref:calcium-binding protein n=1 Tax=Microcoleus sp. N3A4 TaxID=3055379 RepID=UPI002FCE852B
MALRFINDNGLFRLFGDNTAELIELSPGPLTNIPGGVWLLGGNDTVTGSTISELIVGNNGQDSISGGEGNDSLFGGKGNDQLSGGEGDDFLSGDRDIDTLTGGQGRDTFALSTGGGLDIITDFDNTTDYIQVPANLNMGDILIQTAGANTLLTVKSTGEQLAQLNNVQASSITTVNFLANQPPLQSTPTPVTRPDTPVFVPPDFSLPDSLISLIPF